MVSDVIAVASGVIAVLGCLWLLRTKIQSERSTRRSRAEGRAVFVGGLRYHATGGVNSGTRTNFTRPFGLLDIEDGIVTLSLSREARALVPARWMDVDPVTLLRPDEVIRVEADFGSSRGLRFRTRSADDSRDGLVFWPKRRDRDAILSALRAAGFPLV